jgi:hypothetical protein
MKSLILALTLSLSSTAFARQYFQCSTELGTDVMVLNLTTPEKGTLFLSSGMQNPENERTLVKVAFDRAENGHNIYSVIGEVGQGQVAVPAASLGKPSDYVVIDLSFANYFFSYTCFTRIYND